MPQHLSAVSLLVHDYDEAIAYFTRTLNFILIEDTALTPDKRWVLIAPPGASSGTSLLLARAKSPDEKRAVGNQAGGRVFLFLSTDDFWRDYREMKSRGITFLEAPREEPYATVAVFTDLYGNKWDLVQPKKPPSSVLPPAALS